MSPVKPIFPLFTVLFLGFFGFSLALPLFPPLFLDQHLTFLPPNTSYQMRRILLGILFGMYPLGQFIGAPFLGKWSDKYGRKPILLISLVALIPAYIGTALSIFCMQPLLLFISRFFTGILEGDIVIAQAAIADVSGDSKTKTKNFGWYISLSTTAFFFGPLVGGKLANSHTVAWFHYDTPFWLAAIFSLVSFSVVSLFFRETHMADSTIEISLKSLMRTLLDGLRCRHLKALFIANFFIFLQIFFFLNFFSVYLIDIYHFPPAFLGEINAYLTIPIILISFVFGWLAKMWSTKQTTQAGIFLLVSGCIMLLLTQQLWALFLILIPIGFSIGIGFAFPAILISNASSQHIQGQSLGTNQSIQVFAEACSALIGGLFLAFFTLIPLYLSILCGLISAYILIRQVARG